MSVFFCADTHLGHANIVKYAQRPELRPRDLDPLGGWASQQTKELRAHQMNERLIAKWNERVKPGDHVYFLGDFCCYGNERGESGSKTKAREWLERLNGTVTFILGNHDHNNTVRHGLACAYMQAGGLTLYLVHNPAHEPKHPYVDAVVHGHVHTAWKVTSRPHGGKIIPYVNVGVDVCKYAPVALNELLGLVNKERHRLGQQ